MTDRIKSLTVYSGKCVTGASMVYLIASLINYKEIGWALISVMLVLTPDGKDAVPLAITRIKANVIGAGIGLMCLTIAPENLILLCCGIVLAISICYLFKLDTGIRSALAAVIIILLHDNGRHLWDTAIERVISVLAGCVLGLIITFAFHTKIRTHHGKADHHQEA